MALWGSVAEGDTYFATRLYSDDWTAAITATKTAALTTAQNDIINSPEITGLPGTATDNMKNALFEQAIFLIAHMQAATKRGAVRAGGVKQAATVGETYTDGAPLLPLSPRCLAFLGEYVRTEVFANDVVEIVRAEDDV